MTRRLVFAILGTAVAALLLAGLGTVLLAQVTARRTTERATIVQASSVAAAYAKIDPTVTGRPAVIDAVRKVFRIDDLAIQREDARGQLVGPLPKGIGAFKVDMALMRVGIVQSGHRGHLVWAAAPATDSSGKLVVAILLRRATNGLQPAWRWFLLSSLAVIALGALVAVTLSRRLTRPIRDVDAIARRLASGDLSTRLDEPPVHQTDELSELARSVNAMAVSLERSKVLEQEFLLSVTHDLRTPLTSIRGYAEAISDGATTDPVWAAGVIVKESHRLERLVADLLDLAKLQAKAFSFRLQPMDLAATACHAAMALDAPTQRAELILVTDAPLPVPVVADPDRVAQMVANLVENAQKYARSTVTVGARVVDGVPILWVDDDGPGIAEADRPHVFERLYRTSLRPIRAENSSGLGLAIVAELASAMHGTASAETAPGGGARIVVRFRPATS